MPAWGKYLKHYNAKWEKEKQFQHWLQPSTEEDVLQGKPEAYCKFCKNHIRAHHSDLVVHANRIKHKEKAASFNRAHQPTLHNFGHVQIKDESKEADLKLSVFIAMHCAVQSIDHLGEILTVLGKGSTLEKLRLHRTKCSKLISNVVAPAFLTELINDIGDSPYSLIVDESTDVSTMKFMALCVRCYSTKHKKMVTDFLGIIRVHSCTGEDLAKAVVEYLQAIGLVLGNLHSIGTDGAPNMCGVNNSFFTHLRSMVPGGRLQLLKCVCHSLDKCAEYAFKTVPNHLQFLWTETYNYFCHSTKRKEDYTELYKAKNGGKEPLQLMSLCQTRWLVWLPVSTLILDQWSELKEYFRKEQAERRDSDFKLDTLVRLFNDNSNMLLA